MALAEDLIRGLQDMPEVLRRVMNCDHDFQDVQSLEFNGITHERAKCWKCGLVRMEIVQD